MLRTAFLFAQISGRETAPSWRSYCTSLGTNDAYAAAPSLSNKLVSLDLAASRLGLDPALNRFHAPLVNHENYSFDGWPENHTFPVRFAFLRLPTFKGNAINVSRYESSLAKMNKFERIAYALTHTSKSTHPESPLPRPLVRSSKDFFRPLDFREALGEEWLSQGPIDATFVKRFLDGNLSAEECRTIGFREQTSR